MVEKHANRRIIAIKLIIVVTTEIVIGKLVILPKYFLMDIMTYCPLLNWKKLFFKHHFNLNFVIKSKFIVEAVL